MESTDRLSHDEHFDSPADAGITCGTRVPELDLMIAHPSRSRGVTVKR